MTKTWYYASRYVSPGEFGIEEVPEGYVKSDEYDNGEVFRTWAEAKAWLVDQSKVMADMFRYDLKQARALRKPKAR
jgi:hypothetical protein